MGKLNSPQSAFASGPWTHEACLVVFHRSCCHISSLSVQGLEHPEELHGPCGSWGTVLGESFLPCLHRSKRDEDITKQGLQSFVPKSFTLKRKPLPADL